MDYFDSLKQKADNGDAESQYLYGRQLSTWNRDEEAVVYLKKASDQNYPKAQAEYGRYLYNGENVERDVKVAIRLWKSAIRHDDDSDAFRLLGRAYLTGNGVRRNYAKALELLQLVAKDHEEDAICDIARIYFEGLGVEKDEEKGLKLYKRAAKKYGVLDAMIRLYEIYWDEEDFEESIKWMKAAAKYQSNFFGTANDDDLTARKVLAQLYLYGQYGQCTTQPNPRAELLEQIVLPQSLKAIGIAAFEDCTKLREIVIPDGVVSIGDMAFGSCYALKRIVLPPSIECLDRNPFRDTRCRVVSKGVKYVSKGFGLYTSDMKRLVNVHGGVRTFTVPEGVEVIGEEATAGSIPAAHIAED